MLELLTISEQIMTENQFTFLQDNFHLNFISLYDELKNDFGSSDVTLLCSDEQEIRAHRFMLSSGSQYFKNILKQIKQPHSYIFMAGVNSQNLRDIIYFLYHGQVTIEQEVTKKFLELAKLLNIQGISSDDERINVEGTSDLIVPTEDGKHDATKLESDDTKPLNETSAEIKLSEQIETMMYKENTSWYCSQCKYSNYRRYQVGRHIERMHITGYLYSCDECGVITRAKPNLDLHKIRYHPKNPQALDKTTYQTCEICGHAVSTKSLLKIHMYKKHNSE